MEKFSTKNRYMDSPDEIKLPSKNSETEEYDASELSKLLKKCKGGRTTTDFSKETGVSITYLTKLLNGNSPSRPSKKYLRRIAYPEFGNGICEVQYEELLKAAGYSKEEIDKAQSVEKVKISLPMEAKREFFPISFMIDNLFALGEINAGFDIHNADNNGWFVIKTLKSNILCVPALFENFESEEKNQRVATNFMVATVTQQNIDKYYILTNQRNYVNEIKKVLPKLPGVNLYVILTEDFHTISERELVY